MSITASLNRRKILSKKLGKGMAIIPAAVEVTRNSSVEYPFRQDSNFHYFADFPEPEAVLIIFGEQVDADIDHLFVRPKDEFMELWTGFRFGTQQAKSDFNFSQVSVLEQFDDFLIDSIKKVESIYLDMNSYPQLLAKCLELVQKSRGRGFSIQGTKSFHYLTDITNEMRLIKDEEEIACMRQAQDISRKAHMAAMAMSAPGIYEYQVQALMDYIFKKESGSEAAYRSIIAAGNKANTLHYIENNQKMMAGDCCLIDAGVEINYYASDITRTFPVSGKFTSIQKDIYEVVLEAQKSAISIIAPNIIYDDVHKHAVKVLSQGLIDLKILSGSLDEILESKIYREFYPHATSHWLGLDVHDTGDYQVDDGQKNRLLAAGMVLTVEPGLYFNAANTNIPEELRGLGVRIENDILVTATGFEDLTKDCPREVSAVEEACGQDYRQYL